MLKVLSDILLVIDAGNLSALVLLHFVRSFRYGRPQHFNSTTKYLSRAVRDGATVVRDTPGRPAPVRTNRIISFISGADCVWCTAGIGHRPILFLLYTGDLISLIQGHSLNPHLYADDRQCHRRTTDVVYMVSVNRLCHRSCSTLSPAALMMLQAGCDPTGSS